VPCCASRPIWEGFGWWTGGRTSWATNNLIEDVLDVETDA
jgi:hypothetical protein